MAASQPSVAQLFYDVGRGFNESDSVSVRDSSNSLNSFRELSFNLPRKTLFHLRFDPLVAEGRVAIRNVAIRNRNAVLYRILVSDIQPFNQIANWMQHGDEIQVATTPGANDPGLTFTLREPIRLRWIFGGQDLRLLAAINACLIFLACAAWVLQSLLETAWQLFCVLVRRVDKTFGSFAARFSSPAFIQFDAFAIWIYAWCLSLFVMGGVLDLNGSSEGMYSAGYGHGARVKSWIGAPRAIRADEWAYETPDILNQYLRADHFAAEDSVLGNHYIALTANVPVKHMSTVFRPQFWSFFVLPVDYAYAFYWQAKALILMGGVFTFLLWITGSSAWALTGALWYFFSPLIQWSYSWPSALPEMIGTICLATIFFAYLTVGRNSLALALSAIGASVCSIDFALCAYLPHMIPLFWVAVATLIAWCIVSSKSIFVREKCIARLAACALAFSLIAIIGWTTYGELKPAISSVAQTVYPGQRVVPGGSMPIWELTSHFMQWTETENQFPAVLGNICEGSGFLWLAPVTLLFFRRVALSRFQKCALIALWCCFLLILCWLVLPLPVGFGRIFGLDRTLGARCLPALGLANIGIVSVSMAGLLRRNGWRRLFPLDAPDIGCFLAAAIIFFFILRATNLHLDKFFTSIEVLLFALFLAGLATLMISRRPISLAVALVIPQLLLFGRVNPVERGLPVFEKSELYRFVQGHPYLLHGRWLVFSDTPVSSGFFAAVGCRVYTGTRYMPDVDDFPVFASRGLNLNAFNRLGYLDARAILPGQKSEFALVMPVIVRWDVAPMDPMLDRIGIRYVAFDAVPRSDVSAGLIPVSDKPVDGFWLYELPKR